MYGPSLLWRGLSRSASCCLDQTLPSLPEEDHFLRFFQCSHILPLERATTRREVKAAATERLAIRTPGSVSLTQASWASAQT